MLPKLDCVLLVDDDDATNFYNRKIIGLCGLATQIRVVKDGAKAIEYLEKSMQPEQDVKYAQPDLIFLDLNMPVMNGWEFLAHYRAMQKSIKKRVVIVILSASCNPEDMKRSGEIEEVYEFKSKPLSCQDLTQLAQKHFSFS